MVKTEYIKQNMLTTMQHIVVDNICQQLSWLHDFEVNEVSLTLGWQPTSYDNSYDLAKLIVWYDILPDAKKIMQKYKKNVEVRMNPPEDKIPDILYMSQRFKPYDGDIDMLLFDLDSKLFSEADRKAKNSGSTRYGYVTRYDNGYSAKEKYQMIFDKYPGKSLHNKMLTLAHWKRAWLKAIDLVCGSSMNEANSLWNDNSSIKTGVNNSNLIAELEEKQKVAYQYNKDRRDALRKVENESMQEYAKDQEKIRLAEKEKEAAKKSKEEYKTSYSNNNGGNSCSSNNCSSSSFSSASSSAGNDFWNLNTFEERKTWLEDNPVCSGCGSRYCNNAWCNEKY